MYDLLDLPVPKEGLSDNNIVFFVQSLLKSHGENESSMIRLDVILYHLYGLTYNEVLVVDPDTPITREEYEAYKGE